MMKVENVCIFNYGVNENDIKIINDIDSLKEFLIDAPICLNDSVIGVITEITNVLESQIYGTVMFYDDKYKNYKYFKNYEVQVDYDKSSDTEVIITGVSAIYLRV